MLLIICEFLLITDELYKIFTQVTKDKSAKSSFNGLKDSDDYFFYGPEEKGFCSYSRKGENAGN